VTLEDILEEIVGEFTTDPSSGDVDIVRESSSTFLVDGAANIREMNRAMNWTLPTDGPKAMNWTLPTDGPKTLNGLIVEYLETIPEPGTGLKIEGYPIEIVATNENRVKTARIHPRQELPQAITE
jgi:Mg2+/Co2+ transporter CorB